MFNNSAIWKLIAISDWVSKYIILLGLFILSVVCVAVVIYKLIEFSRQKKRMKFLLRAVKQSKSFSELAALSRGHEGFVGDRFLIEGLKELKSLLDPQTGETKSLSQKELEELELLLCQDIEALTAEQEQYLPILGISAPVSPLVGLFGTIWGLINAFFSISQEKSADIAVIAPGIAAALLTTLAGLMVAIPAMIMFNYFSNELRKLEGQLYNMQDLFLMMAKQTFVK
ncbi:MAG: MotA/TolQ/ExbB proton channel family protein [bacterium]